MLALLKQYSIYIFYFTGAVFFLFALFGKVRWCLLFAAFLLPLRNVVEKLQGMPLGKDFLDILILGMLAGWIFSAISNRKEKFMEYSPVNVVAILLIVFTFISYLRGSAYLDYIMVSDPANVRLMDWKNFVLMPVFFFLTFNNIQDKRWVWRLVAAMCLSMLFMNYYVTTQISWFSSIVSRNKINGTFVYLGPNEVAAFLDQYTVLLMSVFFAMKRSWAKLALAGLILANIYCILFLFSRAAYVGLAVGLFLLFAIRSRKLLVPLIIIIIFWHAALPQKVKERIEMTADSTGQLDVSISSRLSIWEQSRELFMKNPVLGVGLGVFPFMGYWLGDTHNIYMEILAEQGIFGIFIFLLLAVIMFFQGLRLYNSGDDDLAKGLGLGFAMCVAVLLVNNVFGDRWSYMEVNGYLWIFAGLVARLNLLAARKKEEHTGGKTGTGAKKTKKS